MEETDRETEVRKAPEGRFSDVGLSEIATGSESTLHRMGGMNCSGVSSDEVQLWNCEGPLF